MPINDCPKSYVGQSKRETGTRLKEHKANVIHGRYDKVILSFMLDGKKPDGLR